MEQSTHDVWIGASIGAFDSALQASQMVVNNNGQGGQHISGPRPWVGGDKAISVPLQRKGATVHARPRAVDVINRYTPIGESMNKRVTKVRPDC